MLLEKVLFTRTGSSKKMNENDRELHMKECAGVWKCQMSNILTFLRFSSIKAKDFAECENNWLLNVSCSTCVLIPWYI